MKLFKLTGSGSLLVATFVATALILSACDNQNLSRLKDRRLGRSGAYLPMGPGINDPLAASACTDDGVPGSPTIRPLTNDEYLFAISDLIGTPALRSEIHEWNPTTSSLGFEGIAWAAFDKKGASDRLAAAEKFANAALVSSRVMKCVPAGDLWASCGAQIVFDFAEKAFRRPLTAAQQTLLKTAFDQAAASAGTRIPISNIIAAHDTSSGLHATGWVADVAWPERNVEVHFYVDGIFAGATIADLPRPDVNAYLTVNVNPMLTGNYAFVHRLPDVFANGLNHNVVAYAIGAGNPAIPPSLTNSRLLNMPAPPPASTPASRYYPTPFKEGIRAALTAVLASPYFLFKFETPPSDGYTGVRPLDDFELASRLSFFITSSIPDDALLAAAKAGTLRQPAVLQEHTLRLLTSHAERFSWNFAGQWLGFKRLDLGSTPGSLDERFARESKLVFKDVLISGVPVNNLLDPGFSFLDATLAAHYQIPGVTSNEPVKVVQAARGGILRQGSVLKVTSSAARTSPVHRGKWVLERMLCKTVPLPGPELLQQINNAKERADHNLPVHLQLKAHRDTAGTCYECHKHMDPLGLSLEVYDPEGRQRTAYADGKPVVADGEINGTQFVGADGMMNYLKSTPEFSACFAEKLATYAFSHELARDQDKCAAWQYAQAQGSAQQPSIAGIILRIVNSSRFLNIRHGGGS